MLADYFAITPLPLIRRLRYATPRWLTMYYAITLMLRALILRALATLNGGRNAR